MKSGQRKLLSGASQAQSESPLAVLMVGDEARSRRLLAFGLTGESDLVTCAGSEQALDALPSLAGFGVVLLDWDMKAASGPELLEVVRLMDAEIPIVVTVPSDAVGKMARQKGATRCMLKPFSTDELRAVLTDVSRPVLEAEPPVPTPTRTLLKKAETSSTAPVVPASPAAFGSQSPLMQRLLQIAQRVAPSSVSILILGENGTGKTALARAIHERSQRPGMPFVTVNCPCLQAQLLESELFGHVRGSFTGAVSDTLGKVAAAEGGTLFLDEIGELPLEIQPKLLRLLQDREYERVGETRTRRTNIRVVAATNRDLKEEVKAGRFREDLYYRLNVVMLDMPPLRQRPEDIVPLAEEFLREVTRTCGRPIRGFTLAASQALSEHAWPGNIRELRNVVERAAILSDREWLDVDDFPAFAPTEQGLLPKVGDFVSLAALEEAHIREVIARTQTLGHAAHVLGIDKATLYRKRKRLPGSVEDFSSVAEAS